MKHLLKVAVTLVTTLLVVAMPLAGASAQPTVADQAFVSEVSGEEVDLGTSGDIQFIEENYDLRETRSFQEEYIWFTYGWSNFQLVMIAGPNESADYHDITLGNMEDFYDDWELLDEEVTDEHSWFLGSAELDGSPLVVYYEFELDAFGDVDLVTMQFTDASTFQTDLEFVQDEVTIGGDPLLPDTDAAALAELAGAESATPDSSPESDDADDSDDGVSRTSRGGDEESDDTDTDTDTDEDESNRSRTSRGGSTNADTDEDDSGDGVSRTSRGGDTESDDEDTTDTEDDSDSDRDRTSRGGSTDDDSEDDDSGDGVSRSDRGGTSDTDSDDDENESETGGDTRISRTGTSRGDDADTDTDADTSPVSGGDWDSMGLISDTEWESPTHGKTVTWDAATWEFPVDYDSAIIINEEPPYDVLTLQTTDGLGYVYLTVDLAYEGTPESAIDFWTSDDYLEGFSRDVTVLGTGSTPTTATMVYETTNTVDEPLVVVMEVDYMDDGSAIFSQVSAAPETIDEVYGQYIEGVEVDGAPLESTFTPEEIRDLAGN